MFSCLLGLHNLGSRVFFMGFSGKNRKLIFHFSLMFRLRSHEALKTYFLLCDIMGRLEKFTALWEEYVASFFFPVASIAPLHWDKFIIAVLVLCFCSL